MKCIKNSKEVKRVKDEMAVILVKQGWRYCPKKEYKDFKMKVVKPSDPVQEETPAIEKPKKVKKSRKTKKVKETNDQV
jgi:hypothetical protein